MLPFLADARRGHPGLFWMAIGMAALTALIAGVAVFDQRELLGAPLWLKPAKFTISFTAYGLVMAWMLGRLPTPRLRRTGWLLVAVSVIEVAIIAGQAARGQRSHFNDDGGTGSLLFSIMGASITVLYLATVWIAVWFLRERSIPRELATAIRFGLLAALAAMTVGFLMVFHGAHAVGVPDGGPGLPLVGWSTEGGDLRVAHFVGLHALQVLPLIAAGLVRYRPGLGPTARARMVAVLGYAVLGLVGLLTWQALRAQPVLAADALTVTALSVLVVGTGFALVAVARSVRPARPAVAV